MFCSLGYCAPAPREANSTASFELSGALQRNAAQCEEITMSRRPTYFLRHRAKPLLFSLVGLLPMATGSTASAAVNVCMPLVKAAPAEANTATDAKRSALANWRMDASMHGVEYTGWGIAWNHEVVCIPSGRRTIICQAAGHPCTVRQVPPDNFIPFRRGVVQSAINPESLIREARLGESAGTRQR